MQSPPIKEKEIVYLFWFLVVSRLPRTARQAKAVLALSGPCWQITPADVDMLWPDAPRDTRRGVGPPSCGPVPKGGGGDSAEGGAVVSEEYTDRDRAILWARQMIEQEFVVLDTETTGLESDDVAVQIGIVDRQGVTLLDTYVKPHKPIPAQVTRLHGITDAMVSSAPTILDLELQLIAILSGRTVIIYNADYDHRILRQSCLHDGAQKYGVPYQLPDDHFARRGIFKPECAMEAFAAFYGDWNDYRQNYRWQKLTRAAAYFDIHPGDSHTAAADALTTLRVVEAMAKTKLSTEEEAL